MPTSSFFTSLDPNVWQLFRILSQIFISLIFIYLSNAFHTLSWNSFLAIQPVFSLVYLPMIAIFMWGVNIVIFRRNRINWIAICEFHPQKSATAEDIFEIAASFLVIFSSTLFLFSLQIPSLFAFNSVDFPFLMVLYVFLWSVLPLDILSRGTRYTFLRVVLSVVIAPAGTVKFLDAFVGDILTSMVRTLFDFEYTLCFYMTGDYMHLSSLRCSEATFSLLVLSGLPLFWRFMQCLSHYKEHKNRDQLANAVKYMLSLFTVLFNAWNGNLQAQAGWSNLRLTWLCIYFISTLYSCFWDVRMDWGLMEKGSIYWGLRKNLVFPVWCYYVLIVINIFLRFFWCFVIGPLPMRLGLPRIFVAEVYAILEVIRRFLWAILRFEWEHVNIGVGKTRNAEILLSPNSI